MEPLPEFLQPLDEMIPPFPREAMEAAIERREESTPHLLQAIETAASIKEEDFDAWGELDSFHIYALFLLAQMRETRAFGPLVRLMLHPQFEELGGDAIWEYLPRIIASVCGGDLGPIKTLVEDRSVSEYVRPAALESLGVLVDAGVLPREELSTYLGALFAAAEPGGNSGYFWDAAINLCVVHRFTEHLETIRALYRDGIADPEFDLLESVEEEIALPPGDPHSGGGQETPEGLIDSAIDELKDWWCYDPKSLEEEDSGPFAEPLRDPIGFYKRYVPPDPYIPPDPYVRTAPKIGRNDPCPCGSGRKFKKCCGAAA